MTTLSPSAAELRLPPRALFLFLLVGVSGLGQFSTSLYLPSLPSMASSLGTSLGLVQMTISVYLATFAVAQLVYGPITDRYGRRSVLLVSLFVFCLGTLAASFAPAIEGVMAGRVLQGLGAAGGVVLSRAITRDTHEGPALFATISLITLFFMLVPTMSPLIGGVIEVVFGWRGAFVTALIAGLALLLLAAMRLPETNRHPLPALDFKTAGRVYASILRSRTFLTASIVSAFLLGGIFAFMAGSPDVYITALGISPAEYGLYPPITILGFYAGIRLQRWLIGRRSPWAVMAVGLGFAFLSTGLLTAVASAGLLGRITITAPMMLYTAAMGLIVPTATASAIAPFFDRAGSASALIGFIQMLIAAAATLVVARLVAPLGTLAFPVTMLGCVSLAALSLSLAPRAKPEK